MASETPLCHNQVSGQPGNLFCLKDFPLVLDGSSEPGLLKEMIASVVLHKSSIISK